MKTYNNTFFTEDQLAKLVLIGTTISKWRQRNISLFQHPTEDGMLISVGITFDGAMRVVSSERKEDWATALDYIAHGKVYVRE